MSCLKKYTVIGYYPDNDQAYVGHTTALNPSHAVELAPHGVTVIAVLNGWHDDAMVSEVLR